MSRDISVTQTLGHDIAELASLRMTLAKLEVGAPALNREGALALVLELEQVRDQLHRLWSSLARLVDAHRP